jgi:hypothetical protein
MFKKKMTTEVGISFLFAGGAIISEAGSWKSEMTPSLFPLLPGQSAKTKPD